MNPNELTQQIFSQFDNALHSSGITSSSTYQLYVQQQVLTGKSMILVSGCLALLSLIVYLVFVSKSKLDFEKKLYFGVGLVVLEVVLSVVFVMGYKRMINPEYYIVHNVLVSLGRALSQAITNFLGSL